MITHLSHATVFVLDYDQALDFYTNKLGFEARADFPMEGGFRWLTVGPKNQPDLELVLYKAMVFGKFDGTGARLVSSCHRSCASPRLRLRAPTRFPARSHRRPGAHQSHSHA